MKKIKNSYLLLACVLVLALLCVLSIYSPMRFDSQRAKREKAVKTALLKIRTAEEKYRISHDTYTGSFDELVKAGLLADSLRYIPYTDKKQFNLHVSSLEGKSGNQIPLMECSAEYKQYLDGLDKTSVSNLVDEANAAGRFAGLKIGDLEEPNNNAGNWE